MCALVQGIRKVGIKGGGPSIGDAKNPMHIVRTTESHSGNERPTTSHRSSHEGIASFGQKIVEDPSTQVDEDRDPHLHYENYTEQNLDSQLSAERADENHLMASHNVDVERGKSFGRRRRKPVAHDLEKGPE